MSDNEKLIKEALHAYHGVEDRGQSWAWSEESVESMRAALAVFEKAHTPTDEPEWEYGTRRSVTDGWERGDRYGEHEYIDDRSISDNINEDRSTTLPRRDMTRAVRRRKAGEWMPVEN